MAATTRKSSEVVLRSLSPSRRFCGGSSSPVPSAAPSAFASSTSSFSSRSSTFFQRSASPTRVNIYAPSASSSIRFTIVDRSISPSRSIKASPRSQLVPRRSGGPPPSANSGQKKTCMCSPTTHPGSFRCSLHKNFGSHPHPHPHPHHQAPYQSNRLNARRSAMTNSLVRIGSVEGDLVRRALSALIRPSSHQQRRRAAFQPRPSRLSVMSKAEDL